MYNAFRISHAVHYEQYYIWIQLVAGWNDSVAHIAEYLKIKPDELRNAVVEFRGQAPYRMDFPTEVLARKFIDEYLEPRQIMMQLTERG